MIAWFTRHPVAANLLMAALLIGGFLSASHMRNEIFPKLPASELTISVYYEGRSAEQVDKQIGQKLEQALQGINGIQHVSTVSQQDEVVLTVKKQLDYPIDRLFNDIKTSVDNIYDWPVQAEKPQVYRNEDTFDALTVQLLGNTDKDTLIKEAGRVKAALLANPAIHKLEEYGAHAYSIYIEVVPDKMRQHQLSFDDIAIAIKNQSVLAKTGLLKTDNGQFLLHSDKHAQYQTELAKLLVKVTDRGDRIYLADIATIKDAFIEHDSDVLFNNQASIGFSIKMSAQSDVLAISEQAHKVVAELNQTLPDNLELLIWFDSSQYVQSRLDLLSNNAWQGFLLVFLILTVFLKMRLAFWVAMGLPIAIAGSFIVLGPLGLNFTINEITTFGFIMVLGILVDDAVVVGESIYSHKKTSNNKLQATIDGAKKVAMPTIFGVLTTVAALLPMTRFASEEGRLFAGFAWVMIIALLFSLIESKFILPAHLRHLDVNKPAPSSRLASYFQKLRSWPQTALDCFVANCYQPLLVFCLRYRYAWLISFIALCLAVLGALFQGKIRSVLFPDVPSDFIVMTVELESNAPLTLTQNAFKQLESSRTALNQEYKSRWHARGDVIEKSLSIMDEQGQITVFAEPLAKAKRPGVKLSEVAQRWRQKMSALEGVVSTEVIVSLAGSDNGSLLHFQHPEQHILNEIVSQANDWLSGQTAVRNVKDPQANRIAQLAFTLKPEAQLYGISQKMLADQLSAAYGGLEVDRFYRQQHQVKVYLNLPRTLRNSRADFSQLYIFNQQQEAFPLLSIANIETVEINNAISRYDGALSRALLIDIDKSKSSPEQVYQRLMSDFYPEIVAQYPLFKIKKAGELEQIDNAKSGLVTAFAVALLGIYCLLALPLKRYGQPLIIMSVIPFGIVGALLGHVYLDLSVSLNSWLGMLALSGVLINDSLLIVSCYNEERPTALSTADAAIKACSSRFRAIFLTTITTFAGLYPLLQETSEQAQYLIPAAVAMAYGLLFATLLTLFLIPVILLICNDIKVFVTQRHWQTSGQLNCSSN
ncbi:efflux RND transporter permease subunit [Catenovulum sp. SM1970]|uniref:efflux RND transporter permease subunit n=1 Tax=Marinifaba aquimaris TaxID=2741323 RepID=UPI001573583E|nr:efflux RND transporter permease subunit [Marinifaba aquimaris]NTS77515.1 efflux RND transporter permease subunit [Marinifaba aquimaris]